MAMAEAGGPTQLLEVCGQRLSRFLHDAEHKHLAWLREVEEQGMRLLDSNFGAEPELMPKTPSQRRRPKKRRSSCLKDENKEPNRRRLSRRRSSVKPVSSKLSSQKCPSKEQPRSPGCLGEEVSMPEPAVGSQANVETDPLAPTRKRPAEAPAAKRDCGDSPQGADGRDAACQAATGQQLPEGDVTTEPHGVSSIPAVPSGQADGEEAPERGASTSTPKAARNGDPAVLQGDLSPQGLKTVLFQDADSKMTKVKSKTRRCSGRQSSVGGPNKSHRTSLAQKYSLAGKRESMIRRSISRAISKKAASRESSSASSRVSCQSSLEVFVEEDGTSSVRPGLELNPLSEKTPEDVPVSSKSTQAASPPAQHLSPPEQRAGNDGGSCVNPTSEDQNKNQEQPRCAESQQNPSRIWTRNYKQAMGTTWNGQQQGGQTLSPLDNKHKSSANQTPASSSPASRVVRPLKNFLQAVQRNQLLTSPGPTGRGGIIKNFIKHNTPTRPNLKEKERQRLESLRKKQEAEEQRRKKVEEEKRRRQAEMKQKREERLRKALQARERVEQMEEEKKKRMEQKILQNDDKVRLSQVREEKGAEERSRRKLSRKPGEADARKQKVNWRVRGVFFCLLQEEDEFEQQGPLQKRREDEVKEKGNKVLELRNLVEQQQVEQAKERDHKQCGKEKAPQPQLESAVFAEKNIKEEEIPKELPGQEKRAKLPEPIAVASHPWLKAAKEDDGLQKPRQQLREEKKIKQPEALSGASGTWLSKTAKFPLGPHRPA
ncbi:inner centromere [Limosa lapponica baueri]|uniref:Inner centromere n=1 Tax=Limosa lapponica baueri TaxID=1758121 RepID=A0A2I0TWE5_LIMLA|nr:inner centromere [Limosa lapponica baueri]